jgi:hypothetical protein
MVDGQQLFAGERRMNVDARRQNIRPGDLMMGHGMRTLKDGRKWNSNHVCVFASLPSTQYVQVDTRSTFVVVSVVQNKHPWIVVTTGEVTGYVRLEWLVKP